MVIEMQSQFFLKTASDVRTDSSFWINLTLFLLIASYEQSASGQNTPFGDRPQNVTEGGFNGTAGFGANQNMVTEFRGKLKGFQRGVVYVQKDDGTDAMVQLPESIVNFQFVAMAKPAFLQRGQLVRLSGTFNPVNGMALTPINKVELFQPVMGGVNGRDRERFVPGVYPQQRDENPQAFAQPVRCAVVGAVMGLNANGVLMVQAGGRPMQIPLAPEVTFEIRYNNLSLAQEGDEVSVSGFYQPPNENQIRAERITVSTERIYGEPSKEMPKRGSRTRTTRRRENDPSKPENKDESADNNKTFGQEGDIKSEADDGAAENQG